MGDTHIILATIVCISIFDLYPLSNDSYDLEKLKLEVTILIVN